MHCVRGVAMRALSLRMSSLSRLACTQSRPVYKVGRFVPSASAGHQSGEVQFQPEKEARIIDMRSDVMTKPTPAMREAMALATADDEIFREDGTVLELESQMAKMFGKEAALFVPSGTMGNLIGVMSHCPNRGLEVLLGDKSHMFMWEQGGMAQIGGLNPHIIPNKPDGTFDLDLLEDSIRPQNDPHQPYTGLIVVENTHNYCGGKVIPIDFLAKLKAKADKHNIPIHVDGARILNAAVALNVTPKDLMEYADSVSFCFSKGIGAPVGSVLVGSHELIDRALRLRKVLGGGWRKPGALAAAALVAMEDAAQRLLQDHNNAKMFAKEISACSGGVVRVDVEGVHSNIVLVEILKKDLSAAELCQRLSQVTEKEYTETGEAVAVDTVEVSKRIVRFTTYSTLTTEDVCLAAKKTCYVLTELSKQTDQLQIGTCLISQLGQ